MGLEWGLDSPRYFAYSEGDRLIVKVPATPPPRLHRDLVGDSKDIYLFGLKEFRVRVKVATDSREEKRSIAGSLSYVKVKSAPFHWRYYLKRVF